MRKSVFFLLFILFSTISFAQFSKFKSNPFSNTILLGINFGVSQSETDFSNNDLGFSGFGFADYFFSTNSKVFPGLKLELGYINISGTANNLSFDTDIISLGPSATINYILTNDFYPYAGIGVRNLWYDNYSSFNLNGEIGFRYLLSKFFTVNGSIGLNFVFDDKLDDLEIPKSNNDFYATFSLGFSYAVDLTIKDDIDGDGILNINDACPEQSEDFDGFSDDDGCPEFDNDNDGIVDIKDKCPDEAEDFDGFEDSDGCPDPDNDLDGVMDFEDNCPDLKEDFDNFNDLDGCPDLDNDNDGIVDINDECPDRPESFNNFEDLDGCPDDLPETKIVEDNVPNIVEPIKEVIPEKKIRVAIPNEFLLEGDEIFENGSSIIKKSANKTLNSIADQMKTNIEFSWRIEGHLDNSGTHQELKVLSTKRANAIKSYFVSKGLTPNLFQAIGLGDEVPIAPNSSIQGKLKNRRIVIKRIK
jgi:outer membrane protein OmpA-like peptidoglycan-associated protein